MLKIVFLVLEKKESWSHLNLKHQRVLNYILGTAM